MDATGILGTDSPLLARNQALVTAGIKVQRKAMDIQMQNAQALIEGAKKAAPEPPSPQGNLGQNLNVRA